MESRQNNNRPTEKKPSSQITKNDKQNTSQNDKKDDGLNIKKSKQQIYEHINEPKAKTKKGLSQESPSTQAMLKENNSEEKSNQKKLYVKKNSHQRQHQSLKEKGENKIQVSPEAQRRGCMECFKKCFFGKKDVQSKYQQSQMTQKKKPVLDEQKISSQLKEQVESKDPKSSHLQNSMQELNNHSNSSSLNEYVEQVSNLRSNQKAHKNQENSPEKTSIPTGKDQKQKPTETNKITLRDIKKKQLIKELQQIKQEEQREKSENEPQQCVWSQIEKAGCSNMSMNSDHGSERIDQREMNPQRNEYYPNFVQNPNMPKIQNLPLNFFGAHQRYPQNYPQRHPQQYTQRCSPKYGNQNGNAQRSEQFFNQSSVDNEIDGSIFSLMSLNSKHGSEKIKNDKKMQKKAKMTENERQREKSPINQDLQEKHEDQIKQTGTFRITDSIMKRQTQDEFQDFDQQFFKKCNIESELNYQKRKQYQYSSISRTNKSDILPQLRSAQQSNHFPPRNYINQTKSKSPNIQNGKKGENTQQISHRQANGPGNNQKSAQQDMKKTKAKIIKNPATLRVQKEGQEPENTDMKKTTSVGCNCNVKGCRTQICTCFKRNQPCTSACTCNTNCIHNNPKLHNNRNQAGQVQQILEQNNSQNLQEQQQYELEFVAVSFGAHFQQLQQGNRSGAMNGSASKSEEMKSKIQITTKSSEPLNGSKNSKQPVSSIQKEKVFTKTLDYDYPI